MLDTKIIIYEGNVIEMFLRKSVLRLESIFNSNSILFDNETESIWLINPKVQQQDSLNAKLLSKFVNDIYDRYLIIE